MKKTKKSDATAFKRCENEQLFLFVKDPESGKVKICVGNNLVSGKDFDNFDDAESYVSSKPYELMINTACVFMQNIKEHENEEKK